MTLYVHIEVRDARFTHNSIWIDSRLSRYSKFSRYGKLSYLPFNIQANAPYLLESHLYNSPIVLAGGKKWVMGVSLYFTQFFCLEKGWSGRLNKSDHFSQQLVTLRAATTQRKETLQYSLYLHCTGP